MNVRLLAVVMVTGLVLSGSSVYLNKVAFADDPWSSIEQREMAAQKYAATTYSDKYQFNNMNASQENWSGLSYTTTSGYGQGLQVGANTGFVQGTQLSNTQENSLRNAMSEFDKIHAANLTATQSTNYTGLNSTTTDEQGRNRNVLLSQAETQSLNSSESIISALGRIDAAYINLQNQGTTNEQNSGNRQAQIEKTENAMALQAAALITAAEKLDTNYLNLQSGPTTNGYGQGLQVGANTGFVQGTQLSNTQENSLNKAIQIFQEIHAQTLASTYSTGYTGLNSTTTNEQGGQYDRQTENNIASETALQNALNTYNAYYNGAGLNQTTYSH